MKKAPEPRVTGMSVMCTCMCVHVRTWGRGEGEETERQGHHPDHRLGLEGNRFGWRVGPTRGPGRLVQQPG